MAEPQANTLSGLLKEWLPKLTNPEYLMSTPPGQVATLGGLIANPGLAAIMPLLGAGLDTKAGKEIQQIMDATPAGGGLDDMAIAGARTASKAFKYLPEGLAMVPPLATKLGLVKPRGVPAGEGHYFHSNLAEAVDKEWLAKGEPSDILSIKKVQSWLNKLPGLGVKKKEIEHFKLNKQLGSWAEGRGPNPTITKQELADLVDRRMPRIEAGTSSKYNEYVMPTSRPDSYKAEVLHTPNQIEIGDPVTEDISNSFYDPDSLTRGHWPEYDSVLGWVRGQGGDLVPGGRLPTYQIDEMQSDWHQNNPDTYPLPNYHDLMAKYVYKRQAEEGVQDITSVPGAVHIERWGGYKVPKGQSKPKYNNIDELPEDHTLIQEYQKRLDALEKDHDKTLNDQLNNHPNDAVDFIYSQGSKFNEAKYALIDEYNKKVKLVDTTPIDPQDVRFSGHELFYNRRIPSAFSDLVKSRGGEGAVSEVKANGRKNEVNAFDPSIVYKQGNLYNPLSQVYQAYADKMKGWNKPGTVMPEQHGLFHYQIPEKDLALPDRIVNLPDSHPLKQEYQAERSKRMYEKGYATPEQLDALQQLRETYDAKLKDSKPADWTFPLWMLLGGVGLNALRGTSTNSSMPE